MSKGQFRCCIYANNYEQTLEFYGGSLGFPVTESWDRGPDDKGTLFSAVSGIIEVLARPRTVEASPDWGEAAPRGVMVVIEVENVDEMYSRIRRAKLRASEETKDQEWGHRSFRLTDPNGLELYFYNEIDKRSEE